MKSFFVILFTLTALAAPASAQEESYSYEYCAFTYDDNFEWVELGVREMELRPNYDDLVTVKISELTDRLTGENYYRYATFLDEDDGGNTIGWVADSLADDSELLAIIADGSYEDCKVKANPGSLLVTKIDSLIVLGEDQTIAAADWAGSLPEFFADWFDGENTTATLSYEYVGGYAPRDGARKIAEGAWLQMTNDTRFQDVTCGYELRGDVAVSGEMTPDWPQSTFVKYTIAGNGDGGFDSCADTGGPGAWAFALDASFSKYEQSGQIKFSGVTE